MAGVEWSYGYTEAFSGVFAVLPKSCRLGTFREAIHLGNTDYDIPAIINILSQFRREWRGIEYNSLNHNCLDFCQSLIDILCPGVKIPEWAQTMRSVGQQYFSSKYKRSKFDVNKQVGLELAVRDDYESMWHEAVRLMEQHGLAESKSGAAVAVAVVYPVTIHSKHLQQIERKTTLQPVKVDLPVSKWSNYPLTRVYMTLRRNKDMYKGIHAS